MLQKIVENALVFRSNEDNKMIIQLVSLIRDSDWNESDKLYERYKAAETAIAVISAVMKIRRNGKWSHVSSNK